MTHSAPSVRQESVNNKKAVNVISAKKKSLLRHFFRQKRVGPVIFCPKKVHAPSFFSQKNCPLPYYDYIIRCDAAMSHALGLVWSCKEKVLNVTNVARKN